MLYVCDANGVYSVADPNFIINEAKRHIGVKMKRGVALTSPNAVRDYLQVQFSECEHEVFSCLFLDKCAVHRYVQRHRRRQYGSGPLRCLLNINDDGAVTLKHPISGFFGGHHAQPTLPSLLLL